MNILDPVRAKCAPNPGSNAVRCKAWGVGILLPIVMAGLSACTSTQSAATFSAPRTIDASQAMIMPAPGGPMVLGLIEERFRDGVEQKVILGTDASVSGENYLIVRLYGPMERETRGRKRLGYKSATSSSLFNESIRAVPGVPMKTSGLFLRNSYGPFGYAFGQTRDGDSCIYGWQQLRSSEKERTSFRNTGAIQIRLRVCEAGASEKQLLTVMYGYTIVGGFASEQWNPFGNAKTVTWTPGIGSDPIYPKDAELVAPLEATLPRAARRQPVIGRTENVDAFVIKQNAEDETTAKRVVDVPAPLDTASDAATDGLVTPAGGMDSSVTVPSPGCPDGNSSCN